jgi:hypothetical protein
LNSLGAAHAVAQWARWKTVVAQSSVSPATSIVKKPSLTLFDTILLGLASLLLLLGNALNAFVVVVLDGSALL